MRRTTRRLKSSPERIPDLDQRNSFRRILSPVCVGVDASVVFFLLFLTFSGHPTHAEVLGGAAANLDGIPVAEAKSATVRARSQLGEASAREAITVVEKVTADIRRELPGLRFTPVRLNVLIRKPPDPTTPRAWSRVNGFYDPRAAVSVVIDCRSAQANRATLRHEAAHQVMHRCLHIPVVSGETPFWYREGLACYFEGDGKYPQRVCPYIQKMRVGVLDVFTTRTALPPVADLLSLRREHSPRPAMVDYALAWSFAHFLLHGDGAAHRDAFLTWISTLQDWRQRRLDRDLFRRIFPDPEALHPGWTRHVAALVRAREAQIVGGKEVIPIVPDVRPAAVGPPITQAERKAAWGRIEQTFATTDIDDLPTAFRNLFTNDRLRRAAPQLLAMNGPNTESIRRLTAESLGLGAVREALGALVGLSLRAPEPTVRAAAARAVRDLNHDIAPRAYFLAMNRKGPAAMQRVVEALEHIGDPHAVGTLRQLRAQIGTRMEAVIDRSGFRPVRRLVPRVGRNAAEEALANTIDRAVATLSEQAPAP